MEDEKIVWLAEFFAALKTPPSPPPSPPITSLDRWSTRAVDEGGVGGARVRAGDGQICAVEPRRSPLRELIGNLSYTATAENRNISGESLTKRRRIDLADPSTISIVSRRTKKTTKITTDKTDTPKPTKRPKAPGKKPRTVTDAATAAYQPPEAAALPVSTVSKFFSQEKATDREPGKAAKKPRKPRAKKSEEATETPITTTKKSRKKKVVISKPDPPLLYTPLKATAQADSQCFFFGTSSQLMLSESPTLIREMQTAIEESEALSQPPRTNLTTSPRRRSCLKVPTAPHGTSLSIGQAEKEHWCASARDWKGGLLREKSGLAAAKKSKPVKQVVPKPVPVEVVLLSSSPGALPVIETLPSPAGKDLPPNGLQSDSFLDIDELQKTPEDSRAIRSDSFMNIDDISDHEKPPTPSPPRRRASAQLSPVPKLSFAIKAADDLSTAPALAGIATTNPLPCLSATGVLKAMDAQWAGNKSTLFPRITATVKGSKRSSDPTKPSWHQKILLYDPIVLEDLTAWLNEQKLRIEVRRLKPKSKAKSGGKGKGKKKKADEIAPGEVVSAAVPAQEIETLQEELQAWMVQKWCEEKSICCLWKEGLRGGVRSRY
ncbi:5'-flap endonuclease [Recurvomyces mirabilis]|uniref:Structure-specific endonuclease subunit SLX4 n=1 Tax=Recurvomyces mirabilis TaxID=574656 RepID=A0AAE1C3E2_9PEZI|nr:5'-flap endonuclease [Recurvomyces mirabilis]KAK5154495.1 5'-flap endonuclease [Recurvomyces mirabilis]